MRALVTEPIAPEGIAYLRRHDIEVELLKKPNRDELLAQLEHCDALITRSGTAVTADLLDSAPQLRVVARAGVGIDNIDLDACTRYGILVVHAPRGNAVSAAEHTIAMLLALVRQLPCAHAALKSGRWSRSVLSTQLPGKTVGIVGLGRVGSRVATRLRTFGVRLVAYDPYIPRMRGREVGARLTDFDTVLRESDIITFHVPLTEETHFMVTSRELDRMKRGVWLVNCARGGIIHEGDLLAALDSERVAGAAIDVWTEEPPKSEAVWRLVCHPRTLVTPHLGANTVEAQQSTALEVARQLVSFHRIGLANHGVNLPPIGDGRLDELIPWLALAERLGRLAGVFGTEAPATVEVGWDAGGRGGESELLSRAVLAGLLAPLDERPVTLVNAHLQAAARGIVTTTSAADRRRHKTLAVTLRAARGTVAVSGGVVDGRPHIISLCGAPVGFNALENMLVIRCEEQPGLVRKLMVAFEEQDLPIMSVHVACVQPRKALVVVLFQDGVRAQLVEVTARALKADVARFIASDRRSPPPPRPSLVLA